MFDLKKHTLALTRAGCRTVLVSMAVASAISFSTPALSDVFISSFSTNQLMRFDENTGAFLGDFKTPVDGPFASQIGFNGDLFVSSFNTGQVLRFDSYTGEFLGPFITAGSGGLTNPTAPNFGPDGKVYVCDLASNRILRYDSKGNFLDVFADQPTSGLNGPFMQAYDKTSLYVASGYTNSIRRYDLKTKKYLGEFVTPGSGGLVTPVGLEFGPDGNLYTSSSGTNAILRYDGKTGAFIDEFVHPGNGLESPRAIRFGGPNSDLYVISFNNDRVMRYDRTTGEFLGVVFTNQDSGFHKARGLTFTPKPDFRVFASPSVVTGEDGYVPIKMDITLNDYTDPHPTVELVSITVNDPNRDASHDVEKVQYGKRDTLIFINAENESNQDRVYTFTYKATNAKGASTIATTTVTVPAMKNKVADR